MTDQPRDRSEVDPVLVVIPTYNERDNIGVALERLHTALPDAHVLVVDDGSPDGTGEFVDKLAAKDQRIHILHRTEKAGLGAAYIAGFRWGLERDYATIVEMDADGSHAPEDLPRLLDALTDADLVIGSRYVPGGKVVNWPRRRELLSVGANIFAKIMLGVEINDVTAGFRAYRRTVLETLALDEVTSHGYCFQIDLAWRTVRADFEVVEVPITFTERETGESKMDLAVVREALLKLTGWGLRHRFGQLKRLYWH
ncbi:dolichol-phosphate mannosyltransferase [Tamaricihabitans halophyticus]|uniref:Dolichol-phosphate mannosyltransferase n=1 Tax=Tamaricihabitans halophyticus TaxID=1262583 RepID=A0A4R2QPQ1_9PSEU|nr:polyprenol monophosphomannose synthase [Tamaricihabitans halophyticus]TCP50944.1 dolichol-phosphate mannosyltransferase [Tamaricihabitans halophyticus]